MHHVSISIEVSDQLSRNSCVAGENHAGYARCDVTKTCQWCRLVRKDKGVVRAAWEAIHVVSHEQIAI